jgi:acid phosphatase family membrane protein YuiD
MTQADLIPWLSPIAWSSLLSMLVAQGIKPLVAVLQGKQLDWARMLETGGMPSSHTSLVTTLTLAVAAAEGVGSTTFAVVLLFSGYFVFEATGLRQEVGEQAKVLNDMIDELVHSHHLALDRERLRELVGHTWSEVLGGAIIGALVFLMARPWILGR